MPYPHICNKCNKEIAFQDAYKEGFDKYFCSACWKSRPLEQMPPGEYEHGCEGHGDFDTSYCCYKVKGESLKLRTVPDDSYYTDIVEINFCPFCGYKEKKDK